MKLSLRKEIAAYKAFVLDMDGTLYYQIPLRICMAFALFFYYIFHLNKISQLFAIYKYRKKNELGERQEQDATLSFWMQEKPKKYIHFFRDKKIINFIEIRQRQGAKIVVYSDYPLKEKLEALSPFLPDFAFSSGDSEIQCLKPCNKGLLHIVNTLHLPVEDIVFLGDRFEKDAMCSIQTGMDYVILSPYFFTRNKDYKTLKIQ